ncbi:MAG: thioesterase family protein [Eubacterium sp.]|nr:thioesterase family protein [Eubacterium sp.]
MKAFNEKLSAKASTAVSGQNTAKTVKSGSLDVFATPMMLALMEEATCAACSSMLDEGETTVGTCVSVTHDKASGIGTVITADAVLENVDGRKLTFSVQAQDDKGDIIGKGTIERFVVLEDKFMKRVNGI